MAHCEQMPGLSVLEHGESVHRYYQDLRNHVLHGQSLAYLWQIPDWASKAAIWEKVMPLDQVKTYQIFHDCGKPACRMADDLGRVHFPNHAKISEATWRNCGGSEAVARLIGMDMDIHLLRADGLAQFIKRPECATLLLTGLAEIHSNAVMFGGIDSTSFKMKWKHIDRRGRQIAKALTEMPRC